MNIEPKKVLEAHIQFELNQWKGDNLAKSIQDELTAIVELAKNLKLELFLDKQEIIEISKKVLIEREITKEEESLVNELALITHDTVGKNSDPVPTILEKNSFYNIVYLGLNQKELRSDVIHSVTHSTIYSKMISNILYSGIKDFFNENAFTKNVPGASSLLKMGQDFFGNIPGMKDGIDKKLTEFIETNVQNSLKQSEKFLNQEIDNQSSKEMIDETWKTISLKQVKDLQKYSKPDELKTGISILKTEWNHFKKSPLFTQVIENYTDFIIKKYKDKTIGEVLNLYEVKTDVIILEISNIIKNKGNHPDVQKIIENRIRFRFEKFYNSKEALELFK